MTRTDEKRREEVRGGCARETRASPRTVDARGAGSEREAAKPRGPNAPARAMGIFHGGCGDWNARARRVRGAWGASRGVSGSWGGAASTRVLCACARAHLIVGVSRGLALRVGHLRAFRRARGLVRHLRGGRYSRRRRRTARARPFGGDDDGTRGTRYAGKRGPARFNARADCFGDAVDACALWFDARARSCAITFAPEPLQTLIRAALRPSARALP